MPSKWWDKEKIGRSFMTPGRSDKFEHFDTIILFAVGSILIITLFVMLPGVPYNPLKFNQSQTASWVGIAAFTIPIILALSRRFNLAARFGNGEVRKAIVIALTIVYIIMLSSYFYDVTLPLGKNLSKSLSNSSPLPIVTLPVSSQLQNGSSGSAIIQLQNISPTIPGEALKDISTNFFWIYAVIIVFYFGSRAWESVAETNMVKELEKLSPVDLAQRRYVLGMLSPENYEEMKEKLEGLKGVVIVGVAPKDDKDLKDADEINLIVKNLGNEVRTVKKYQVNSALVTEISANVPPNGHQNISVKIPVDIIKKTCPKKYEIKISADEGADSTYMVYVREK